MDSGFCLRPGDGAGEPLDGRQLLLLSDYGRFAHSPSSDHNQQYSGHDQPAVVLFG